MDGVLIDAKDWHYDALNAALQIFGYYIGRDAHLTTFDGLPTRQKLKILTETRGLPRGLWDLINELKQKKTLAISYDRCRPTFNHQFAMSQLRLDGLKIGVCSNSIRQTVETMMQLSSLDKYIDVIFSNEDVTQSKPHPEMYQRAMDYLNVKPTETIILEDNDHGIQAALASGAHIIKIDDPKHVTYTLIKQEIDKISGLEQ